jgi:hypothetical protein
MVVEDVVIIGGARTPFCEWSGGKRGDGQPGGLLKDTSALKLGEIAIMCSRKNRYLSRKCRPCSNGLCFADL